MWIYIIWSRCLNRVANDKSFSKRLRPTGMFVTCTPQGPTLKVDDDKKDSVRGQLQERFHATADRGESVQLTRRVVQDLTHVDIIKASNRVQEWEDERRILILFKRKLIEAVYILLCVSEFGPIPIRMNDETAIYLSTENLHALANIVNPMCGYELW